MPAKNFRGYFQPSLKKHEDKLDFVSVSISLINIMLAPTNSS